MENTKEETVEVSEKQKTQNLMALCIILGGLFVGSLFVDFLQLASGEGFSSRTVKNFNVLESEGKTWVGYSDPLVKLHVITDESCESCDPNEALVWLRRVIPTLEATKVDAEDEFSKSLISRFDITTLPAFIFSDVVSQTNFYSQASSLFTENSGSYFFDMTKIGLPVGKYLRLPAITETDVVSGPADAKVTVIEFTDFQCPFCKQYHKDLMETLKTYGDQVRFVYKSLPLSFHAQAENAALSAYCANEQGKFQVYTDYLFTQQDAWSATVGTQKFKDYAWWLRLNGRQFTACVDKKKYAEKIASDKAEAGSLSVQGTPGTFINGTFLSGAVTKEELRAVIDTELTK